MNKQSKKTCGWVSQNPLMIKYHDAEWGVPVYDDRKLFEYFILDCFQAGLSWEIVLNKRANFKKAFDNFDYKKIAKYTSRDVKRLLNNTGIIRNRLKIASTITNAQKFLEIQKEFGNFSKYIWQFVANKPKLNKFKKLADLPATSFESDAMSLDLKKRGFKFVGSTIIYAFMQAAGLVNDHTIDCWRYNQVNK